MHCIKVVEDVVVKSSCSLSHLQMSFLYCVSSIHPVSNSFVSYNWMVNSSPNYEIYVVKCKNVSVIGADVVCVRLTSSMQQWSINWLPFQWSSWRVKTTARDLHGTGLPRVKLCWYAQRILMHVILLCVSLGFYLAGCPFFTVTNSYRQYHWGKLWRLLPNPNVLVAISKGMRAVKLCCNKIIQFLTGGAS